MTNEQETESAPVEGGSHIEAKAGAKEKATSRKTKAPEKEHQVPQYEGDVNAYVSDAGAKEKATNGAWETLSMVARQYGRQFIFDEKKVHVNTIPAAELRQFITIAEAFRTGKLY